MASTNFELHVIQVEYNKKISPGLPVIEFDALDQTTWSSKKIEDLDFCVNRELAKLSPCTDYDVCHSLMKSKDMKHFRFSEGCYDSIMLIVGKNVIYWHAESRLCDDGLRGIIQYQGYVNESKLDVGLVESILDAIQTDATLNSSGRMVGRNDLLCL